MDELPQETIGEIATCLDEYDLRNLSLVSHTFVAESQRQIFRTIAFHHSRIFLQWYQRITPVHPIIPFYVKSFFISFGPGFHNPPTQDEQDCYMMASKIFASFANLERIHLHNLTLSQPHQFSMVSNFSVSAPSLQYLRIDESRCSPGLMAKFIYLFPHLDDLYMENVKPTDIQPYNFPTHPPSFRGYGRFTPGSQYGSHLRRFPFRFKDLHLDLFTTDRAAVLDEQTVSTLNEFFVTCAPTLEHLTFYGPDVTTKMDASQIVDLSPCKRLRTFRLDIKQFYPCPPHIIKALSSLESSPRLETITLTLTSLGTSLAFLEHARFGSEWAPIDAQLCRLAELRDGGLRVCLELNRFRVKQGMPTLDDFGTFMTKLRSSPHSFTILCDSHVVNRRETELQ